MSVTNRIPNFKVTNREADLLRAIGVSVSAKMAEKIAALREELLAEIRKLADRPTIVPVVNVTVPKIVKSVAKFKRDGDDLTESTTEHVYAENQE